MIGEVWYAEADTPTGPWAYGRKIVTHEKYSFYNVKHHPCFDQDGGRLIYFEGTYTKAFSGTEVPTPRYDYNQIMYRLALDDPRLFLPVAVYRTRDAAGAKDYLLREQIEDQKQWDRVEAIPFFACPPDRVREGLIPIWAARERGDGTSSVRLLPTTPKGSRQGPLFYAMSPEEADTESRPDTIVALYEYRDPRSGEFHYAVDPESQDEKPQRTRDILCLVWRNPLPVALLDSVAKPLPAVWRKGGDDN